MIQVFRSVVPPVLACSLLTFCVAAQSPRVAPSAPTLTSARVSGLEAGLASIKAENVKADIFFIASDELGGRDTPSNGQRVAARFIRARLQRLGVQPGTPDGFFYRYKLVKHELDLPATKAQAVKSGETIDLAFGADYGFSGMGVATAVTAGNIVFCGDTTLEQLATLDLAGKWALCEDNGLKTEERRKTLKKTAAIGLMLAPGVKTNEERVEVRIKDNLKSAQGTGGQLVPQKSETFFPSINISATAVAKLLALSGSAGAKPAVGTDLGVVFTDTRKDKGIDSSVDAENVCGFWPGSDPVLSKEVIIISAHYDHVGTRANGTIYNGADDNGSGTTGLLQLAEALTATGPMRRSVMLLWVSGEEKGLWGSEAWCSAPSLPEGTHAVCDLNIDMIGRNAPDYLLITPTKEMPEFYNGLTRLAEALGPLEGFPKLGNADKYWTRSDHRNFAVYLKVPVAFLFNGEHEDYHQPTDDPEKIDCDKIRRVARLVLRMIDGLQTDTLDL